MRDHPIGGDGQLAKYLAELCDGHEEATADPQGGEFSRLGGLVCRGASNAEDRRGLLDGDRGSGAPMLSAVRCHGVQARRRIGASPVTISYNAPLPKLRAKVGERERAAWPIN